MAGDYKGKTEVIGFFFKYGRLTEGTYRAEIHDILASNEHTIVMSTAKDL